MDRLPVEVLHEIISHIQRPLEPDFLDTVEHYPWLPRKTLASLCITSKSLAGVAQPLLYRSLGQQAEKCWRQMLALLCERPDLARLVRRIDTRCLQVTRLELNQLFQRAKDNLRLPEEAMDALEELLSIHQVDEDSSDEDDLISDLTVVFCVGLFQDLECIEFKHIWTHEKRPVLSTLTRKRQEQIEASQDERSSFPILELSGSSLFTNLKDIRIHESDPELFCSLSDLECLLFFPSLERLCGSTIHWDSRFTHRSPACKLHLTEIILDNSIIEARQFRDLLLLCPSLRILKISWGFSDCSEEYMVNMGRFTRLLREHGSKLEDLELAIEGAYDMAWSGRLGSLRTLTNLRRFSTSLSAVYGNVSEFLEELGAQDTEDDSDEDDSDEDLNDGDINGVASLESCLPQGLRELEVYCDYRDMARLAEQLKGVATSSRLNGLTRIEVPGCVSMNHSQTELSKLRFRMADLGWQSEIELGYQVSFSRRI